MSEIEYPTLEEQEHETSYIEGSRAAWTRMLQEC